MQEEKLGMLSRIDSASGQFCSYPNAVFGRMCLKPFVVALLQNGIIFARGIATAMLTTLNINTFTAQFKC
jgi:hypothetical protein